ncbi:unnamed protein product, partial [Ectocarpus sp. 13 AM-2016]
MVTTPTLISLSFSPSRAAETLSKHDKHRQFSHRCDLGGGSWHWRYTLCPFGTQTNELYPHPREQETSRRLLPKQRPQLVNGSTAASRREYQTEDASDVGRNSALNPVGHHVLCSRTHGCNRLPDSQTRGSKSSS